MTDATRSHLEPPPYNYDGVFTDEAAWEAWTENGMANVMWHLGLSGGGHGFDSTEEAKAKWPACPGDNWVDAIHSEDALHILREEGKEPHGDLAYRAVICNSFMSGPDRTMDGWVKVGSTSAGSHCEAQLDDQGTMRTVDISGTLTVYEPPTEFVCTVTQCLPDYLQRGANAMVGEVLLYTSIDRESTLEDVLDGLEESQTRDAWEEIPSGSDAPVREAVVRAVTDYLGVVYHEDIAEEDMGKLWDEELDHNGPEGPNVYVYVKPA